MTKLITKVFLLIGVGLIYAIDWRQRMKVIGTTDKIAKCSRVPCNVYTSRVLEVRRGGQSRRHYLCGACQIDYTVRVDEDLNLILTPAHSSAHAKIGEMPVKVVLPK